MDNATTNTDPTTALREKWKDVIRAQYEAQRLASEHNAMLMAARARRLVPMDYDIDYLGDGKVKPAGECSRVLKETLEG